MGTRELRLDTKAVHAGDTHPRFGGAAVTPIFQCSVFEQPEDAAYDEILYPRMNTLPNHVALSKKIAALEEGEMGLVTASGMAAISTTLLEVLGQKGHLLVQNQLYGGTHSFITEKLPERGLEFSFVDPDRPESWKESLTPDTKAIYVESITNPTMRVIRHDAVVRFAKEHDLVSIIDNTFATPVNFRPLRAGYDIALHSATKYLNGHSDLVAGAVVGSEPWVRRIKRHLKHLGSSLDSHACFLLDRGVKTLGLRVRKQNENALALAMFLENLPQVAQVNYPGLESFPDYAVAREFFEGYGGMLSFEIEGGVNATAAFLENIRLPIHAPSLGGVETLVTRPSKTSHKILSPEERRRVGVTDSLLRVSVGIEDIEDLTEDFAHGLQS